MKLLLFSDAHFDAVTAGVVRFDEIKAALACVIADAIEQQVNAVLFLGDLCDPDSVCSHAAAACAIESMLVLGEEQIHSRWLVGNHDVIEDGSGSSSMSALSAACGAGFSDEYGEGAFQFAEFNDEPSLEKFDGMWLVSLPYVSRSQAYDPDAFIRSIGEHISTQAQPIVIVSHLMIEGIGPGSETTSMARGRDVFLPTKAIRETMPTAIVCSGHYHAPQTFEGVHVVGSLVRCKFDEAANETGYMILNV